MMSAYPRDNLLILQGLANDPADFETTFAIPDLRLSRREFTRTSLLTTDSEF